MVPEAMKENVENQGGKSGHSFASFHSQHSYFANKYYCETDKVSRKLLVKELSIK
jgi:hypothetical protein